MERDRLAIGTTAECSVRRNLETLYSHLEDALVPLDMTACFGDLTGAELFFRPPLNTDEFLSSNFLSCGTTILSEQLNKLMFDLIETAKSMRLDDPNDTRFFDVAQLVPLFTVSNLATFIAVFFHSLHWHLPVVHFPTFDPGNTSNPLLLAIFLAGAAYSNSFDQTDLLPRLLDVAKEQIFRKITALSMQSTLPTTDITRHRPTIQLIQAALVMEMLQFGQEKLETRRRIRIFRHPSLVSLMRCLGIFNLKRSTFPTVWNLDEGTWRELVAEEVCLRLASWVFLADGFLTLCFKNRPTISVFELGCSFPWRTKLWEAEDASTFGRIAGVNGAELPPPAIRESVRLLLDSYDVVSLTSKLSLSAEHLLIMIYALNSLAFLARVDFFGSVPLEKIRRAASSWKQIWSRVYNDPNNEKELVLGYPKHAEELWLLLTATLDIAGHNDTSLQYLNNGTTDDLGKLNEFIEWCCRYMKTQALSAM